MPPSHLTLSSPLQMHSQKDSPYDPRRTATFTLLGGALVGPALHFWYLALGRIVTLQGLPGTLARLVLDQGAFAPLFIATFFGALLTVEGHPQDIRSKLERDWKDAVIVNWKIWVPAQAVNFGGWRESSGGVTSGHPHATDFSIALLPLCLGTAVVPPTLQVLFANVVALLWNTYLSWQSHKALPETAATEPSKKGDKRRK